jgi:hypothetical protein
LFCEQFIADQEQVFGQLPDGDGIIYDIYTRLVTPFSGLPEK